MNFDFESLRISETTPIITKKIINSIPLKKPKSGVEFFRIRPEEEWKFTTHMLIIGGKGEGEGKYLLNPSLYPEVIETRLLKDVTIYTGITFDGNLFLSEIALPGLEGNDNEFNRTRRIAYGAAETNWVKLQTEDGSYNTILAVSNLPEPEWPEEPENMETAFKIAFKDQYIDDINHPILKKLRGEI